MSAIFISHSSRDNEFCKVLMDWLDDIGHRSVFLDFDEESGIAAGYNWEQKLYQELRLCRAVIVVCSEHLMNSKWCFAEITQARSLGKHIFPIKVAECKIDSVLTDSQVVDFLKLGNEKGFEWLKRGLEVAGIDAEDPYDWDGSRPPYPGLLAFQEADAAIFFGRDKEIGNGLDVLNSKHRYGGSGLVMTLGASGSGKSSLIRAGIVPRLKRDPERWLVVDPFQPGEQPFMELAKVLTAAYRSYAKKKLKVQSIYKLLTENVLEQDQNETDVEQQKIEKESGNETSSAELDELHDAIKSLEELLQNNSISSEKSTRKHILSGLKNLQSKRNILASGVKNDDGDQKYGIDTEWISELLESSGRDQASLLVIIDQFEELLERPPDHHGSLFLQFLRDLMDQQGHRLIVLGTMRSDFLGSFQQSQAMRGLDFGRILVGPLESAALTDIIEKPATLAGIRVEPKLLQALIEDAGTDDALPLLAFTLRELYDKFSEDRLLDYTEYKEILGGIQGALAKAAENALSNPPITPEQEDYLRRAFLFMARVNEDGNYTREVAKWEDMPQHVLDILKRLVDGRLLVSRGGESGDETIEVAHETIFRSWKRLKDWLDEDREFLLWRRRMRTAKDEWEYSDRDKNTLLKGSILSEATNWFERYKNQLESEEQNYILQSISQAAKERKRKRTIVATAIITMGIIGIIMAGLWISANKSAIEAEKQTELATIEKNRAQAFIEAHYFYGDSLAVISKTFTPRRGNKRTLYGYMNKEGQMLIDYKYTKALPFDNEVGYARVSTVDRPSDRFLGPDQIEYPLAYDLESINDKTTAFELINTRTVPSEVFQLKNLKILLLRYKNLTSLPASIGDMGDLQYLDLKFNKLKSLPPEFGNLSNMQQLNLAYNELDDFPIEITKFTNLKSLIFGIKTDDWKRNKTKTLPKEIENLVNLQYLDLSGVFIESLPVEIGKLKSLRNLDLEVNRLTSLPLEIGDLINLITLDLRANKLEILPDEIGNLINLRTLDLGGTDIHGFNSFSDLPEAFGNLINLEELNLSGHQMKTLPNSIYELVKLRSLNLRGLRERRNDSLVLSGSSDKKIPSLSSLPAEIKKLGNLKNLDLSRNEIIKLPSEIGELISLTKLNLHFNNLIEIPSEIGQLQSLIELDLSENQITEIPPEIGQLMNLEVLDLRGNPISEDKVHQIKKLLPKCEVIGEYLEDEID